MAEEEVALALSSATEWEACWRALCEEEEALEKESWEDVSQPRSVSQAQLTELIEDRAEIKRLADAWHESLWGSLGRLRKRVVAVTRNVRQGGFQEQLHAASLSVERELDGFKARQREAFGALEAEEPLEEALELLCQRFEGWAAEPSALDRPLQRRGRAADGTACVQRSASADVACQPSAGSQSSRGLQTSDDPELQEIRESLKELEAEAECAGGVTGGWSLFHHSVFQRLFQAFKLEASEAFYARLQERLPERRKEELLDHVRWWGENESRQAAKRQLLARWRQRRADLDRQAAEAEEGRRARSLAQQRQAQERKKSVRADQRRQVAEWRRQRAEEEEREVELQRSARQGRERQEREQLRSRQQQQREVVETYRSARGAEAAARERSAERSGERGGRALSQEDKQRIAQRNLELLKRKLQTPPPQQPPNGWPPPVPAKSREWAEVESRLHCSTQSSILKATSKSNSSTELSPTAFGPGSFGRPPRELLARR